MNQRTDSNMAEIVAALKTPEEPDALTWLHGALRAAASEVATEIGEWGGLPVPVFGFQLVMEPRFPGKRTGTRLEIHADPASGSKKLIVVRDCKEEESTIVNQWYSFRDHARIFIYRENGKSVLYHEDEGADARLQYLINTMQVGEFGVWDADAETRAMEKLRSLLPPEVFNCYLFTGSFREESPRSRVTYLFRRLRPTLAFRSNKEAEGMSLLAVLCLHPLGYYGKTWAGVMCPTDDVIAHLVLMRGNERGFWAKANHHPRCSASSGI